MTRRRALGAARLLFVLLVLALAWWGFRGRWGEVGDAVVATGPARLAGAVLGAAGGLLLTAVVWRLLLRGLGCDIGVRDAASVFLVGQLGKYVPGSVWNIAVQAQLGRRHALPVRSSATASLVFLLVHTASGLLLGGLVAVLGAVALPTGVDLLWAWAALLTGAAALAPPLLRRCAARLAGPGTHPVLGAAEVARAVALMGAAWGLYGASLLLLVPTGSGAPGLLAVTAAFALAHAVGVLVVVAPAGAGAREAVLVALLAPSLGPPTAVAVALLARAAHAMADFLIAGAAIGAVRLGRLRVRRAVAAVADRPDAVPLLMAVLLLLVGVQLALVSTVPSWANDEPAHVGYVAALAEGRLPTIETDIVDDPARFPLTAEEFAGRDEEHGDIWTANHPPLFHLAMVPVWWALSDVNQSGMVITMRIANTLGFAAWLYLVGLLARQLVPGRPAVAALAAVVAAAPTLVLRSSYAQNDGWAAASAALLLLMTVRILREQATPSRVLVAAAAGSVAAGTRAQGVLLVALCSVVLLVVLARRSGWSRVGLGRTLAVVAAVGGVPAAAWGWFYVRNYRLYGDFTGQDALLEKFDRAPVALDRLLAVRTLDQPVMATSLVLVAALVLVPVAVVESIRRHGVRLEAVWILLVLHTVVTVVSLAGFMRAGGGFHDRYLMQAMPLLATVTAIGMAGVAHWWRSASRGTVAADRRDWWAATAWAVVLLCWLARTLVWLEHAHVFSRQESSPVDGAVPDVLAGLAAAAGVAVVAVLVRSARSIDRLDALAREAACLAPAGRPSCPAGRELVSRRG